MRFNCEARRKYLEHDGKSGARRHGVAKARHGEGRDALAWCTQSSVPRRSTPCLRAQEVRPCSGGSTLTSVDRRLVWRTTTSFLDATTLVDRPPPREDLRPLHALHDLRIEH